MTNHEKYMQRCIEIARHGAGRVAPNPMVGCVIVHQNRIIGEGYHIECGHSHAEVNAIRSVKQPQLLESSTLYVSLEPCAHHGRTPPCSDLILEKKIPHVVIGTVDPFAAVSGKGIEKLRSGGVHVETGVLNDECRWLNRRFFTFHEKKRPYIILKWAQTLDGYIDMEREPGQPAEPVWITGTLARTLVHKTRAEEAAILVGTNTVLKDNPSLTTRDWSGRSPVRLVIDRYNKLPHHLYIFDGNVRTIIYAEKPGIPAPEVLYSPIDFQKNVPQQILSELFNLELVSVIIEGGAFTLQQFIDAGLWDEAHIYSGNQMFYGGVKAPRIEGVSIETLQLDNSSLSILTNRASTYKL
jgi:diaminohydroxyphosphoribosylaminopyrimidine deaminase / 5-amino-6-(5-phosphoribosylamino)uracil reductase